MKKSKIFQIIVVGVTLLLIYLRYRFGIHNNIGKFMTWINAAAVYTSIIMLLLTTSDKMEATYKLDCKKYGKSAARNRSIDIFNIYLCIIPILMIAGVYFISSIAASNFLNDIYTIISLGLALTNDLLSDILYSIFYKFK